MNELAMLVARSGLLTRETLDEFKKWGLPVGEEKVPAPTSKEELLQALQMALESEELVVARVTDFDVVNQYLRTQQSGRLRVVFEDPARGEADFEISFGRTLMGEVIIPWRSESISEELTNGFTFLKYKGERYYFSDIQEIYLGGSKAFLICTISKVATK